MEIFDQADIFSITFTMCILGDMYAVHHHGHLNKLSESVSLFLNFHFQISKAKSPHSDGSDPIFYSSLKFSLNDPCSCRNKLMSVYNYIIFTFFKTNTTFLIKIKKN